MKEESSILPSHLANEDFCYLTTTGRRTGKPHKIEIWFGMDGSTLYLLSGGMDKSDWVKNLIRKSEVLVRLGRHTFPGKARIIRGGPEEEKARTLLAGKYQEREADGSLSEWARTALVVGIDFDHRHEEN